MTEQETLHLDFLPPDTLRLRDNDNGFLVLTQNGESKGRVRLTRCYPYSLHEEYISLSNLEGEEYGIIRNLGDLDTESLAAARRELENRYFCPEIDAIKSIREKMGHYYFETTVGGKKRNFTVRDISRNVRPAGEDRILIFDMDGNRYLIPAFSKIETKSRRLIEPYLY